MTKINAPSSSAVDIMTTDRCLLATLTTSKDKLKFHTQPWQFCRENKSLMARLWRELSCNRLPEFRKMLNQITLLETDPINDQQSLEEYMEYISEEIDVIYSRSSKACETVILNALKEIGFTQAMDNIQGQTNIRGVRPFEGTFDRDGLVYSLAQSGLL